MKARSPHDDTNAKVYAAGSVQRSALAGVDVAGEIAADGVALALADCLGEGGTAEHPGKLAVAATRRMKPSVDNRCIPGETSGRRVSFRAQFQPRPAAVDSLIRS